MPDIVRNVCFASIQQNDRLSCATDADSTLWLWSNEGDTTGFLGLADFPMQYDLLKYTKIKKARLGASSLIAVAKE